MHIPTEPDDHGTNQSGASLFSRLWIRRRLQTPRLLGIIALVAVVVVAAQGMPARTAADTTTQHYEYVFTDGYFDVYDIDNSFAHVGHFLTPQTNAGVRGESASAATGMLYISYGGSGEANGGMLEYNLLTNSIVYAKSYNFGVDSMDISADGKTIYMPTGENSLGNTWEVIDALSGNVIGTMTGGAGPHNTIVGPSGNVYLASRAGHGDTNGSSRYLYVANGASPYQTLKTIGPLKPNTRPFVINHAETLAFTTASGFLGFQVSSITTGNVLYTVAPANPCACSSPWTTPSHGIALSPDEKELWLVDSANHTLDVFDISGLPAVAPQEIFAYHLQDGNLTGNESPCNPVWCGREGWVNMSHDGRYVFAGDAGDVIDRATRTHVATLPAMQNSRQNIEIDWQNGAPSAAWPRESNGFASTQPPATPTTTPTSTPTQVPPTSTPTLIPSPTLTPTVVPTVTASPTPSSGGTFGLTSIGVNSDVMVPDRKRVSHFSLTTSGNVTKLTMYLAPSGVSGQQVMKGVIYSDQGGSPGTLLGVTSQLTFLSTNAAGWYDMPFATPIALQPGTYWIGIISGNANHVAGFRWNNVSGARGYNANTYSSGPSTSFGTATLDSEQMAIYATYTG